jgi:hypothetical protein
MRVHGLGECAADALQEMAPFHAELLGLADVAYRPVAGFCSYAK